MRSLVLEDEVLPNARFRGVGRHVLIDVEMQTTWFLLGGRDQLERELSVKIGGRLVHWHSPLQHSDGFAVMHSRRVSSGGGERHRCPLEPQHGEG